MKRTDVSPRQLQTQEYEGAVVQMGQHIAPYLKMDLLRLPFVVLRDVFKNMDFREKFLISLMSKRARNTVSSTCVIPHLEFLLTTNLHILAKTHPSGIITRVNTETCYIEGEEMRFSFQSGNVILREQLTRKRLLLSAYLLVTFKKTTVSLEFLYQTPPAAALKFMKMINQRQRHITSVVYHIYEISSEFIPRILNECTEVTDCIVVSSTFPDDFEYTPPRPFKAKEFKVGLRNNWFNLEKFMNCRRISIQLGDNSNRTARIYNSFFSKWMDSDAPLQYLMFYSIEGPEYRTIMKALDNQGTKRELEQGWMVLKRRNGSEFFIKKYSRSVYIYTKQAYLER
uniref:F-box domain-containing protein n=1 Tax=Caenorhabditis tropicalis TaxID=1561998 RepID=A0A1I7UTI9_9PELO